MQEKGWRFKLIPYEGRPGLFEVHHNGQVIGQVWGEDATWNARDFRKTELTRAFRSADEAAEECVREWKGRHPAQTTRYR